MLDDDAREQATNYYYASCQHALGRMLSMYLGAGWEMPPLLEILNPEKPQEETAQQIKDRILSRLKGG